ncbi:MAG: DUF4157 domain-containing protein [Pseudonocardiaceae bacterium]
MPTRQFDTASQTTTQPRFAHRIPISETAPCELANHALLQLQRLRGNRYVQQVLGHAPPRANQATAPVIQAKLMLGPAGDRYEREADRVAREVVRWTGQGRTADGSGAVRAPLQSAVHHSPSSAGGPINAEVQQSIRHARGRGQPLPHGVREPMEQAFGADFSSVRIHTDPRSDRLGQSLQARAFTIGRDIFLRREDQDLESCTGQELLAHELAHVVQQSGGVRTGHPGIPITDVAPAVIQRVGGEKVGFDFVPAETDKVIADGQKLLQDIWAQARKSWHDEKIGGMKVNIEDAAKEMIDRRARSKEREKYVADQKADPTKYPQHVDVAFPEMPAVKTKYGFSVYYAGQLTKSAGQSEAMLKGAINKLSRGLLKLEGEEIKYRTESKKGAAWFTIATLKRGEAAFKKKTDVGADGVAREIYSKRGVETGFNDPTVPKEYVKDSRGVETRRYAYVEKNYYQMMEFFMTHNMEGRFQSYMRAAGDPSPDIYEHRDEAVDIVRPEGSASGKLTVEQMAVAHQKLGSGPQQRGVSLTATPKVNATYVNTGENFRTNRGFRLKVDLSRVPAAPGTLLVNHYSHRGVIDDSDYDNRRERIPLPGEKMSRYPYKESSIHARELFLSQLKPEWIVTIESHDSGNKTGSGTGSTTIDSATDLAGHKNMFKLAREQFEGGKYRTGFNFGLKEEDIGKADPSDSVNPNFKEGFNGSRLFVKGWKEGMGEHGKVGHTDDAERVKTHGLTLPQYIYDQPMKKTDPEDEFDLYRLGYLRGRSGKPCITSHKDLRQLDK